MAVPPTRSVPPLTATGGAALDGVTVAPIPGVPDTGAVAVGGCAHPASRATTSSRLRSTRGGQREGRPVTIPPSAGPLPCAPSACGDGDPDRAESHGEPRRSAVDRNDARTFARFVKP